MLPCLTVFKLGYQFSASDWNSAINCLGAPACQLYRSWDFSAFVITYINWRTPTNNTVYKFEIKRYKSLHGIRQSTYNCVWHKFIPLWMCTAINLKAMVHAAFWPFVTKNCLFIAIALILSCPFQRQNWWFFEALSWCIHFPFLLSHLKSHHLQSVENDSVGSHTDSNRETRNNQKLLIPVKCQVSLHRPFFQEHF